MHLLILLLAIALQSTAITSHVGVYINYRSTEVPKYRSTEVPKYGITEVPKYGITEVPKYRSTELLP